jgi:hypothetical protein
MSEAAQETIYYVVAALLIAALLYGLYRARRWLGDARTDAAKDLRRFTDKYALEIDHESSALRGSVDGIALVLDRGGVATEYIGRGGVHKLLRVTATAERSQGWLVCARFLLDRMAHPLPELGRPLSVEGDEAFDAQFLLRAESEADVPFLAEPLVRQALLDRKLRLGRAEGTTIALSFDYRSYSHDEMLASFEELEGALRATLAVCRPEQAARYLSDEGCAPYR